VLREWFEWMWRDALFIAAVETKPRCTANHFFLEQSGAPLGIAKIEMAMRCSGVGGREVGEKCHGIYGCCVKKRTSVFFFSSVHSHLFLKVTVFYRPVKPSVQFS